MPGVPGASYSFGWEGEAPPEPSRQAGTAWMEGGTSGICRIPQRGLFIFATRSVG